VAELDLLITGADVIDGTGAPRFRADVAIASGRIVDIGDLSRALAKRVIDARGKILAPGFVDAHSHTDFTLLSNPTAESTIRQGTTTEIVGNCGWTHAPVSPVSYGLMTQRLRSFAYDGPIEWSGFGEYLEFIRRLGTSQNLAWLVGHNTLRWAVGLSKADATADQVGTMERLLDEALDAGAIGLSTGLEFEPGRAAPTDEIIRLATIVGRRGGYYASHVRNRDTHLQESIDEFIAIVRASRAVGQVSHLDVRHNTGATLPDAWEQAVGSIERARSEGLRVLADCGPYRDGIGQMAGILPPWLVDEGPEVAARRLRDKAIRARLRSDCDRYWRFIHRGEWWRVRLLRSPQHPEFSGMPFPQIARQLREDEWDAFFDILADAGASLENLMMVGVLYTEEHVDGLIRHPLYCFGVDTFSSAVSPPLSELTPHPLSYAGHVHYLTYHVRERNTISLEEAIRKMTRMPADHFGLRGRGSIALGYSADIVVFDFDELDDVATIETPQAYVKGINLVVVNGVIVVENGSHTGARPGRFLARSEMQGGRK
jgi:N-acyl-D-amino-acid deacylase